MTRPNLEAFQHRLLKLKHSQIQAFAVRAALRAVPLLSSRQRRGDIVENLRRPPFWYWITAQEDDRAGPLFAVLHALRLASFSIRDEVAPPVQGFHTARVENAIARADNAAADMARIAALTALDAIIAARDASAYASEFAANAAANDIYAAAYDADTIYAVSAWMRAAEVIEFDLATLEKGISGASLMYSPLWLEEPPEKWLILKKRFCKDMRSLQAGFEIWGRWYVARLANEIPSQKEEEIFACLSPDMLDMPVADLNAALRCKLAALHESE